VVVGVATAGRRDGFVNRGPRAAAKQTIADANAKLARHRAALEAGADPAVVASWIAQTQAERRNAEAQLREAACQAQTRMSREQIATLVDSLGSLLAALREADPADKAEVYQQLGLRLDYQPDTQIVKAQLQPSPHDMCRRSVSEGGLEPFAYLLGASDDPWLDLCG
jgi:site-specific DNA recombinase